MKKRDQAEGLRKRLAVKKRNSPVFIGVTGGKGGVGKTFISINLSIALKKLGKRVLLVDLDPGLADADILFGVHPEVTLEDCIYNGIHLSKAIMACPGGVLLLPGGSGIKTLSIPGGFEKIGMWKLLENSGKYADIVIFDTGAGIGPQVIDPLKKSDMIVVVTNPDPPAVTDAYALLKVISLERIKASPHLVVNKAPDKDTAMITVSRLRKVTERFLGSIPGFLGFVLESDFVKESINERIPSLIRDPQSNTSKEILSIGANLLNALKLNAPYRGRKTLGEPI